MITHRDNTNNFRWPAMELSNSPFTPCKAPVIAHIKSVGITEECPISAPVRREATADDDILNGRLHSFDSVEEMLSSLNDCDEQ
ncbi:MAG: hypothetical protein K2X38_06365 [Gemmataceae bacterium]|nr:hypothetical protein [Gemmataceae bacterium]